jgi:hypothetical protein
MPASEIHVTCRGKAIFAGLLAGHIREADIEMFGDLLLNWSMVRFSSLLPAGCLSAIVQQFARNLSTTQRNNEATCISAPSRRLTFD